jgi:anti-sigma regulatory factor (Ser/Thr protein kinase)
VRSTDGHATKVNGRWRLEGRLEEVATARHGVRALLRGAGLDEDTIALAELATGELVANALEHGGGEEIEVALEAGPGGLVLTVINQGPVFPAPLVDLRTHGTAERGRGLAILSAFGCDVAIGHPKPSRCAVTARIPVATVR